MDVALLRKAIDWAKVEAARPDQINCEWNQGSWKTPGWTLDRSCGTAYCVAGYIVSITDGPDKVIDYGQSTGYRAAELLGVSFIDVISDDQRRGLFGAVNTIEDVCAAAEQLAEKYGEVL